MDIQISIKAPELVDALTKLAASIENQEPTKPKQQETTPEQPEPKPEPKPKKDKGLTYEEVRAKLAPISQGGKQAEIKALLEGFGVKRLADLDAKYYEDLLKKAEAL